jgi:hypothetical protein
MGRGKVVFAHFVFARGCFRPFLFSPGFVSSVYFFAQDTLGSGNNNISKMFGFLFCFWGWPGMASPKNKTKTQAWIQPIIVLQQES